MSRCFSSSSRPPAPPMPTAHPFSPRLRPSGARWGGQLRLRARVAALCMFIVLALVVGSQPQGLGETRKVFSGAVTLQTQQSYPRNIGLIQTCGAIISQLFKPLMRPKLEVVEQPSAAPQNTPEPEEISGGLFVSTSGVQVDDEGLSSPIALSPPIPGDIISPPMSPDIFARPLHTSMLHRRCAKSKERCNTDPKINQKMHFGGSAGRVCRGRDGGATSIASVSRMLKRSAISDSADDDDDDKLCSKHSNMCSPSSSELGRSNSPKKRLKSREEFDSRKNASRKADTWNPIFFD